MTTRIGIQGAKGSFSEQAGITFAERAKISEFELDYLIDSENVLTAVDEGSTNVGIFALENAQGGVVIESIKALATYRCKILDMFHVMVEQNLMVLPGTKLSDICEIHSHQQALRQCREYLADNFWSCPLIEENDTAESARRLKNGDLTKKAAVIGNKNCAELYGLEIIAPNIHDLKNNITLFLAVEKL